jgi:hypothetical protein
LINHLQIDHLLIDRQLIDHLQIDSLQIDLLLIDRLQIDCIWIDCHSIDRLQIDWLQIDCLQLHHLQISLQSQTNLASKCISKLARSQPPSESPISLNYRLQLHVLVPTIRVAQKSGALIPSKVNRYETWVLGQGEV